MRHLTQTLDRLPDVNARTRVLHWALEREVPETQREPSAIPAAAEVPGAENLRVDDLGDFFAPPDSKNGRFDDLEDLLVTPAREGALMPNVPRP
jgi:hypothetical protein